MMKASKLAKLRRKSYRDAYVRSHLIQGLAFQIREMRISRGLTQSELARRLELGGQSAVARLEDPSYGRMSLQTLLKVAAFFDVAFLARMIPYSRFLGEIRDISPRALIADSFEQEDAAGAIENAPEFHLLPKIQTSSSTTFIIKSVSSAAHLGTSSSNASALPAHRRYGTLPSATETINVFALSPNEITPDAAHN